MTLSSRTLYTELIRKCRRAISRKIHKTYNMKWIRRLKTL